MTSCIGPGCSKKKDWLLANESGNKKRRRSSRFGDHIETSSEILRKKKFETEIRAHLWSPEKCEKKFNTNLKTGLTEEEAQIRWRKNGPNALKEYIDKSVFYMFFDNFFSWFPLLLWGAGTTAIVIWAFSLLRDQDYITFDNLILGGTTIIIVIITGLLGFYQEAKQYCVFKGFQGIIPVDAKVLRDGKFKFVPVASLVVGDIVEMQQGEVVPADVRILRSNQFKIDMSLITGESEPMHRDPECSSKDPLETNNLAFFACQIPEGNARALVVATGRETVVGRISDLAYEVKKLESPIVMEIRRFVLIVCALGIGCGVAYFFLVMIIEVDWTTGFYYLVGVMIANVPEGLFLSMTICLTLSAKKMHRKKCLFKQLQSVETLGAISCICTDKTGTITENRMTISHFQYDLKIFDTNNPFAESEDEFHPLIRAACLCLRADFVEDESLPLTQREIVGDASEKAILKYMEKKYKATELRDLNRKVLELPFTSRTKYQLSIHFMEGLNMYLIVMKGAPEHIISHCDTIRLEGKNVQTTKEINETLKTQCMELANTGERVFGYCDWYLPKNEYPIGFKFNPDSPNFPLNNYRFVGFISLVDPPRQKIEKPIGRCRTAGIKVIMVTGDHPITALAMAKKVGIISEENKTPYDDAFELKIDPKIFMKSVDLTDYNAHVITGEELRDYTDEQLDAIIQNVDEIVFARTTPHQKLRIVESCQRAGHVVAATGDGVNDAPALRQADIGIAMGIAGTDVSKQSSDMILLDDNFASIVVGVEEGRLIFENLKKCIAFTFTSNVAEMMPFILYTVTGIPLPMHALSLVCINVFTDLWPAIALAYERPESDLMKRPPRDLQRDNLVSWNLLFMTYCQVSLIQVVAAMTGYFVCFAAHGFAPYSLLFTRVEWNNPANTAIEDSFGQEWNFEERKFVEKLAQSTYYASVVAVQMADVIICKTRRLSILQHGMWNMWLNFGIAFAIGMSFCVLYLPIFNEYLDTLPIPFEYWLPSLPFAGFIIVIDEFRRLIIRRFPKSWVVRDLYW